MIRRRFLALSCGWLSSAALMPSPPTRQAVAPGQAPAAGDADITLRIGDVTWELAPNRSIKTIAYNGQVPGPLLRAPAGRPLTVEVRNDTKDDELVHWHGFHIPSAVDGASEEGTPPVPPNGGVRRYSFTPNPPGTRWYHSHGMAGRNLRKSTYSGQFGLFVVEAGDHGDYDLEVPILLKEWEPRFVQQGPLDIAFRYFSINGRMLGAGEPIRVRQSQRVLFRILNASATLTHRLALAGHTFRVVALDGNPVPSPQPASVLEVAPGERIDAIVEMNRPGVWILGEERMDWRTGGMGIVIEYAEQSGPPRWDRPAPAAWDYGAFGGSGSAASEPEERVTLVFRATSDGHHWTINGKSHPRTTPIQVKANGRYRWILDNQSAEPHPVHLHRHTFEVVGVDGRAMSGIMKDVVVVPAWKQAEVIVRADHPGPTLFHCHQQFHMDMGFMAMMHYTP